MLESLRSRLRGDLDQMTDEALRRDNAGGTGNLSNVPLHMADLGTDNYDQEFTLGLIENEQGTLELVERGPGTDGERNVRAMRGVRRADREAAAAGHSLCAALHSMCTEAGGRRMRGEGTVGLGRWVLFWSHRDRRHHVRSGDQVAGLFAKVGPPGAPPKTIIPRILELHTSYNTGALWGFGSQNPRQQHDLRRASRWWRRSSSATTCSSSARPRAGS